VVSISRMRRLV